MHAAAITRDPPSSAHATGVPWPQFLAACHRSGTKPNAEQELAIEAAAGTGLHLVAGPGTGKTSCLVLRILKVILVDGVRPEGIVATTFTVKAAAELRSRLLDRGLKLLDLLRADQMLTDSQRRRLGVIDLNQIVTGTVDSVCQAILRDFREPGINPPVVVDEFVADTLMLRESLFGNGRFRDPDLDGYLFALSGGQKYGWNIRRQLDALKSLWERRFQDQLDWPRFGAGLPNTVRDALTAYEQGLADRGLVDFSRLEQAVLDRFRSGEPREFLARLQAQ